HNARLKPFSFPLGLYSGYSDSSNQSTLATKPFSFIPSVVAKSKAEVITLPYFDFHLAEALPTSPVRSIPLGNTQILGTISSFQSIDLAVRIVLLGPLYTTRVQASDFTE